MCAEDCRYEAKVCPRCGHNFTADDDAQAWRDRNAQTFIKALVALVIAGAFLAAVGGLEGLGALLSGV